MRTTLSSHRFLSVNCDLSRLSHLDDPALHHLLRPRLSEDPVGRLLLENVLQHSYPEIHVLFGVGRQIVRSLRRRQLKMSTHDLKHKQETLQCANYPIRNRFPRALNVGVTSKVKAPSVLVIRV